MRPRQDGYFWVDKAGKAGPNVPGIWPEIGILVWVGKLKLLDVSKTGGSK